jgi:tRNA (adenine-N(1)-)-methyltransferase non-catalytic subunit
MMAHHHEFPTDRDQAFAFLNTSTPPHHKPRPWCCYSCFCLPRTPIVLRMEDEMPTTRLPDERLLGPSPVVREHDVVLLVFADGRQIFTQCTKNGKRGPLLGTLKINKSHYSTGVLVGLPYGTVLEVGKSRLQVLAHTEDVIPSYSTAATGTGEEEGGTTPSVDQPRDNRNIVDDNKSQALDQDTLLEMRRTVTDGAEMVQQIVANSASFALKTDFSRAKYIKKKQLKYQQRCRLVRCTAATICEALYMKDSKKFMNLRQDTLGQILASSNITAGTSVLVWESTWGLVTGAIAERMGGYGRIFSVYTGDQPAHNEIVGRFNLSFRAQSSIKWVHASDVYKEAQGDEDEEDVEAKDRDALNWPCNLQDHTRTHLMTLESDRKRLDFLAKRAARFARKITRHSPLEAKTWLHSRQCDSLVIAVKKYDAAETLLALLHHLSPSCPFIIYSEFMEPLTECFRAVQSHAINLRLSDTWAREYQVLPGRTHPKMDMRQSGGVSA